MPDVSASFTIQWQGRELSATVPLPAEPVSPRIVLPVIQKLTDAFVGMGENLAEASGEAVSCREGCAACCRQMVPVAESEARHLSLLVDAMPEPRRSEVRARFAATRVHLAEAGVLERMLEPNQHTRDLPLALDYLRAAIECPFLEAERCSIYADRPLTCREFLVISPAENCQKPLESDIRRVPRPGSAMSAFARLDGPAKVGVRWVPLALVTEWAAAHPEPPAAIPGPKHFEAFMNQYLGGEKVPPPGDFTQPRLESSHESP